MLEASTCQGFPLQGEAVATSWGESLIVPIPSLCTASLVAAAREVQHLCPRQGAVCQRRPVHSGRPPLWASGAQRVRRGGAGG